MDPNRPTPDPAAAPAPPAPSDGPTARGRSALIYCGFCGALNPASSHYCAACGSTLVDAFHASEGLRVHEQPDAASRLVEIVPSGTELEIVEDPDAPADYVRVRLERGRLGYIRLQDVEALAQSHVVDPVAARRLPDINTNARGCITPSSAIGAFALLVAATTLGLVLLLRSDSPDAGILAGVFCVAAFPFLLLTIGVYLYARNRDERLAEAEEDEDDAASARPAGGAKEGHPA